MLMKLAGLAIVSILAPATTLCAQDDLDWSRVYDVSAGAELRVDATSAAARICRLLSADDRGVTVVNTGDLPRSARRVVADAAQNHPERLLTAGAMYVEDDVRIDRDGLWVGSHLVATRARLIERIDKADVREMRYLTSGRTYGKRGAIIGVIAGAAAAYFYAGVWSCGLGAVVSECRGIGRAMMPVGAGVGAAIGYLADRHDERPSGIIYRRP